MALVDYSDSEDSDNEQDKQTQSIPTKPQSITAKSAQNSSSSFAIDKSNPRRIRVNLEALDNKADDNGDDEPAAKRPRLGAGKGGGFGGFNSMLPAPKRNADAQANTTGKNNNSARKVFSLRTGAEPGFSREADAELKQFFADQDRTIEDGNSGGTREDDENVGLPDVPKKVDTSSTAVDNSTVQQTQQPTKGNTFMFKPLSVARGPKKKKAANGTTKAIPTPPVEGSFTTAKQTETAPAPLAKKISLFSSGPTETIADPVIDTYQDRNHDDDDDNDISRYHDYNNDSTYTDNYTTTNNNSNNYDTIPQSLDTIASDLKLSAADRRQLFGRGGGGGGRGKNGGSAINVVNFNTDVEYAANEELRAAGEQVQHNPVRAIAPGKHSLKQLISSATVQKDALEESFATGRRNKREAGNKYGW